MKYWKTTDEPTNKNLSYLENLAQEWPNVTAERYTDRIRGVICVFEMLPPAIKTHFRLPYLYIGSAAYDWSPPELNANQSNLCAALSAGLDAVFGDSRLSEIGNALFADRPATKGEELRVALSEYQERRGQSELSALRQAVFGTNLQRYISDLEKWLARKRPSNPHRSIEYEIACVLGDIERRADDYHHLPASHDFSYPTISSDLKK